MHSLANLAHIRQSMPDYGLGFQVKVDKTHSRCSLFARKRLPGAIRRLPRVSVARNLERYVTKFAPHKVVKLTSKGKLTFDERVLVHRVAGTAGGGTQEAPRHMGPGEFDTKRVSI